MVELSYSLGANSVILGEVLPSGRAISNDDIMLNDEQRNFLYAQVEALGKKYQSKITVQRSTDLKIQLERYRIDANSGGIIRPNGDFRLDCMAPFTIGNVLEKPLKTIWDEKGALAWDSPEVREYIKSIDEETKTSTIRNHVDADVAL